MKRKTNARSRAMMFDDKLKNLSMLVVDDDEAALQATGLLLYKMGVRRIVTASSGSEALTKLSKANYPIDVILCDFDMPMGNGLQLLKSLRAGEIPTTPPSTCFIMVTGFAYTALVQTAAKLHVHAYLVKPFDGGQLKATMAKGLGKNLPVMAATHALVDLPEWAERQH